MGSRSRNIEVDRGATPVIRHDVQGRDKIRHSGSEVRVVGRVDGDGKIRSGRAGYNQASSQEQIVCEFLHSYLC